MPVIDWSYLADKSGDSIEGLIATLLRQKYPNARQTNPSQGDGGIDVIRETPEGLEIYQVKKFTSPLSSSQWTQVKESWRRFNSEHVGDDKPPIAKYYLVTPWTPTDERIADFNALTDGSTFPTQWDGDAFISGLAGEFPGTLDLFVNGPNAFERHVMAKAVLASSTPKAGSDMTMVEAIAERQAALNEFRANVNPNYRLEYSQMTMREGEEPPMPPSGSAAVFHRMSSDGDGTWSMESVVPTSADSLAVEPISLEVTYLVTPGTPEAQTVRDWLDWGIPFTDIPARTVQRGGPFGGEEHENSILSFNEIADRVYPALYIRVTKADGTTRFLRPLKTLAVTHGASTGWLRMVIETPNRVLHLEFRSKPGDDERPTTEFVLGDVEGLDPELVLQEIDEFLSIEESDVFVIEIEGGAVLMKGTGIVAPSAMEDYYRPIAAGLVSLRASTTVPLTMPEVMEIQMGQFETFKSYVSIYEGNAKVWTWASQSQTAPSDPAALEEFKSLVRSVVAGAGVPVTIQQPTLRLASSAYLIERATVTTPATYVAPADLDVEAIQPGDVVTFVPDDDATVTTAALADWSPENDIDWGPQAEQGEDQEQL